MFDSRILFAFLFGFLIFASSAQASEVTYIDNYRYNLNTVAVGQSDPDLMTYSLSDGANYVAVSGFIPSQSKIIFTYTLTPPTPGETPTLDSLARLYAFGSYLYSDNSVKTIYYGESGTNSNGNQQSHAYEFINGRLTVANSLVATLANINPSTGIGTTTIINNSSSKAFFLSQLDVLQDAFGKAVQISYNVVSNVPLPASLPLFVFAAGLLFFIAHRRKEQA